MGFSELWRTHPSRCARPSMHIVCRGCDHWFKEFNLISVLPHTCIDVHEDKLLKSTLPFCWEIFVRLIPDRDRKKTEWFSYRPFWSETTVSAAGMQRLTTAGSSPQFSIMAEKQQNVTKSCQYFLYNLDCQESALILNSIDHDKHF